MFAQNIYIFFVGKIKCSGDLGTVEREMGTQS